MSSFPIPTVARLGIFVAASIAISACGITASQGPATTSGSHPSSTSTTKAGSTPTRHTPTNSATVSGPAVCATLAEATREFSGTPAGSTPAALSSAYANLKAHEPKVEKAAPASIRGDFRTLFNVLNDFYGTLATVGYDYRKLSSVEAAKLAASTRSLGPAATAIQTYLSKNCTSPSNTSG